jgi:predicted HAD superfamily Cof-like phosphohydrolase
MIMEPKTVEEAAQWMLKELQHAGILYQTHAVEYISAHFSEDFIYVNENGHRSIDKEVKKTFKKLHKGRAAWDRDGFFWGWT